MKVNERGDYKQRELGWGWTVLRWCRCEDWLVGCENFVCKRQELVFDAFSYFPPVNRAQNGMIVLIDVTEHTGFDNGTCKSILDPLKAGYLRLWEIAVKRKIIYSTGNRVWSGRTARAQHHITTELMLKERSSRKLYNNRIRQQTAGIGCPDYCVPASAGR